MLRPSYRKRESRPQTSVKQRERKRKRLIRWGLLIILLFTLFRLLYLQWLTLSDTSIYHRSTGIFTDGAAIDSVSDSFNFEEVSHHMLDILRPVSQMKIGGELNDHRTIQENPREREVEESSFPSILQNSSFSVKQNEDAQDEGNHSTLEYSPHHWNISSPLKHKVSETKEEFPLDEDLNISDAAVFDDFSEACAFGAKLEAMSDLLVIPDVHGDITNFRRALRFGKVLANDKDEWVGGDKFVIQTGDVFDRGPDTLEILELIQKLQAEAISAGGCIVQLMGNHELLNLASDFRYASGRETKSFGGILGRREALNVDSDIGDYLRSLRIAVTVKQRETVSLFVHAGLLPSMIEIMGGSTASINQYFKEKLQSAEQAEVRGIVRSSSPMMENGPLWTRFFAARESPYLCETLEVSLKLLSADRMIIGHTVQSQGRPKFKCGGKLVLADTGMSKYYGGNIALLTLLRKSANGTTLPEVTPYIME